MPLLDLENIQTAVNWERYIALVQFILLVYEWFLTLNEEIEFFWQQDCKSRIPAILFYVNRYLTLLGNVPIFVLVFWPGPIYPSFPELGREQLDIYMEVLVLVIQLNIMGVLSAFSPCEAVEAVINLFAFLVLFVIRVTALYGGSWRVRALLSGLGLGAVSNAVARTFFPLRYVVDSCSCSSFLIGTIIPGRSRTTIGYNAFFGVREDGEYTIVYGFGTTAALHLYLDWLLRLRPFRFSLDALEDIPNVQTSLEIYSWNDKWSHYSRCTERQDFCTLAPSPQ
ncbi:hypothetical protein D9757_005930 [Collybiopsis confluens]|uniref:DUF6533 domain-containing protein n=1 Tax=Collybiopsis confluens TaxID=2823264 RepID=A0A8H5HNF2_9AGAR|nr:hypothetical protein D9757_005930 [Collybiopsis confluens]